MWDVVSSAFAIALVIILIVVVLLIVGFAGGMLRRRRRETSSPSGHSGRCVDRASQLLRRVMTQHTNITIVDAMGEAPSTVIPPTTDNARCRPIIVVHKCRMFNRIVQSGELGFAESYMDGDWSTPTWRPY